jgi:hypothetical protein
MQKTEQHRKLLLSPRTWLIILLLGLSGQIAWGIENSWFNTFVYDTLNGAEGFIPPPQIWWATAAVGLLSLIPLFFMRKPEPAA